MTTTFQQCLDLNDVSDNKKIEQFINNIGLPIIVKAASGGGGKGMRVVSKS